MTCRAAILVDNRPKQLTARERLETIEQRARAAGQAIAQGASAAVVSGLIFEIEAVAQIGAAFERRRERGEA